MAIITQNLLGCIYIYIYIYIEYEGHGRFIIHEWNIVDGSEIRLTSWYGKYPSIYMVFYIPGGDRRISFINGICIKKEWAYSQVAFLRNRE